MRDSKNVFFRKCMSYLYRQYLTSDAWWVSVQAYPLPRNFNVGEQELFFKKIWAEMFECDNNIEIQGRGEGRGRPSDVKYWRGLVGATLQFWKICAQKGISVQHLVLEYMLSVRIPIIQKPKLERRFLGVWGAKSYICWDTVHILNLL